MIVINHADCLTWQATDASQYDVMICDPPYSPHVHKSAVSQSRGRGVRKRDLGFDHLTPELRTQIARFAANVRRWSIIYTDVESVSAWQSELKAARATYIRAIPWVRWSMPQLSGDRPPSGCEMLVIAWGSQRGRKSWNGPGNLTHFDHKCLRGEGKHKAEKPLDQLLDLVEYFSNEGENVFDPCAASGVAGLACKILRREYVGLEIDAQWMVHAANRLGAEELSERDRERYARWLDAKAKRDVKMRIMKKLTAKVRAKLDAEKGKRNVG